MDDKEVNYSGPGAESKEQKGTPVTGRGRPYLAPTLVSCGSGVIDARGINSLHSNTRYHSVLYFQSVRPAGVPLGNTPSMQGVPTNSPTSL